MSTRRDDADPLAWLDEVLQQRRREGTLREPAVRQVEPAVDFSCNDYLGLRHDPRLHAAGVQAAALAGSGAGASPASGGWTSAYEELVRTLAAWKRTESALAFSSGYAANVSAVGALVSNGDAVYADRLAHACLIDGARVAGAVLRVFPHNDPDRLDRILSRDAGRYRRRLIVTESLFSMDGDQAPLAALAGLAAKHHAMMVVDEAHATGVFGPEGQGLTEAAGLARHPAIVRMGTLSKAIGCQGGYVVGPDRLIRWMIQAGRGWIYSTALAPYLAGAATQAIRIVRVADDDRAALLKMAESLRQRLLADGWDVIESRGPIVPVAIGAADEVMRIGQKLAEQGFAVGTIRPPTVPKGTSRLRLSVTAAHRPEDIERLAQALKLVRSGRSG